MVIECGGGGEGCWSISNRFAALDKPDDGGDINRAWENVRENAKISDKEILGQYEQKKHKPWFDEECSKFTDQWKQVKLQWLQDPSQIKGDNLNNAGTKKRKY
jgi:hypothetical protein